MPAEIQWSHAARIPLGGLIGYQALFSTDTIQKPSITDGWGSERGEAYQRNSKRTVLITGAGCMAGLWAIELAKLAGVATIIATCDGDDKRLLRRLGAIVYD